MLCTYDWPSLPRVFHSKLVAFSTSSATSSQLVKRTYSSTGIFPCGSQILAVAHADVGILPHVGFTGIPTVVGDYNCTMTCIMPSVIRSVSVQQSCAFCF